MARRARNRQNGDLTSTLITLERPSDAASEAYRFLRASLLHSLPDAPSKVVAVTSPGAGEGKSVTCANLAVVLAQAGTSTLVVDCDLRKPTVHRTFGLSNLQGFADVLAGRRGLKEVRQQASTGLSVVAAGPVPPYPAELLGSPRFASSMNEAREEFDYVLLDSPSLWPFADALVIAGRTDGVLLVLDARNSRKKAVRESIDSLEAVGGNVLGTIMNNAKTPRKGSHNWKG